MSFSLKHIYKSIASIFFGAMLFSCTNNAKQVKDFLAAKNLPIGVAKDIYHIYKDSGRVTSKLKAPLMNEYCNRKEHPYTEFPKGLEIISFQNKGSDSVTIKGNYGLSYANTAVSEIKGNVVIYNHTDSTELKTDHLFWDQKTGFFFTEKKFVLTTPTNIIKGIGFESKENLSKYSAKHITGNIETTEKQK